jgi:hypothetical protein
MPSLEATVWQCSSALIILSKKAAWLASDAALQTYK